MYRNLRTEVKQEKTDDTVFDMNSKDKTTKEKEKHTLICLKTRLEIKVRTQI